MGNLEEISVSLPIFCQIFPVFPSLPQHQSGFNSKRRKGVGSTWRKGWGGTMRGIDLLRSCWEHKNKGKSGNSKPQFLWGACPALSLLPIGISAQKKKKKISCLWPNLWAALNLPLPRFQGENADLSQVRIQSRIRDPKYLFYRKCNIKDVTIKYTKLQNPRKNVFFLTKPCGI